jgi:hypothetical protein
MVALSTGGVISGLASPLAVKIDKLPLLVNEKTLITCERYAIDLKLALNTYRKPWLLHHLVTSFPVSDITELVK